MASAFELGRRSDALALEAAHYVGTYQRPGSRYEVAAPNGSLRLTLVRESGHARASGQPVRTAYDLLPIDRTHFLLSPDDPLEDPQTAAIYSGRDGATRFLHANCRTHPKVSDGRQFLPNLRLLATP